MNEDPGFDAFWAIFPRRDRKIEARYEWRQAAKRFGADNVIVAAAHYAAASRRRAHDDILTAGEWLPCLEVAGAEAPQRSGIFALDLMRLGEALLATCLASRQLGHASLFGTVRDYIAPHGPYDAETTFVHDILMGRSAEELMTLEEQTELIRQRVWAEPGVA